MRPWKRRLAEEITSTLLVVENDQELADEITARLRALRPQRAGVRRYGTGTGPGRPPAVRIVYAKVKPLHLSLPSLADECPEWEWYEEK